MYISFVHAIAQVTQLIFPSKTFFCNLIEFFYDKNLLKFQYLSHIRS
jgi:hypothetical protein